MVSKINSPRTTSPSSILVDQLAKTVDDSTSTNNNPRKSEIENWFSTAVAVNKEMANGFSAAKDEIREDCLAGGMSEYGDEEGSVFSASEERTDDDGRDGPESADVVRGDATKSSRCGNNVPGTCQTEQKGEGIDYLFDLVQSTLCGGCDAGKKQDGVCNDMAIASKDLPVYKMMPELRKDSLTTEDESAASRSVHSSRTHRQSSSRRSRGRTSSRKGGHDSSRRRRSSDDDAPDHRSRSSSVRSNRREEIKKKKISEKIAKKASAFIRENVDPMQTNEKNARSKTLKSGLKPSSYLKQNKNSAFDAKSVTHSSHATVATHDTHISEMRELCVLNIGSGSSVSSFDGDGPSWSQHTKQDMKMTPSPIVNVPSAVTENTCNRTKGRSSMSETDVSENFHRMMKVLINFLYSLSTTMYGQGAAAPVNKTICLISLAVLAIFWPEDREKDRVQVEKTEVPKPTKVSLLHLVTRGGS